MYISKKTRKLNPITFLLMLAGIILSILLAAPVQVNAAEQYVWQNQTNSYICSDIVYGNGVYVGISYRDIYMSENLTEWTKITQSATTKKLESIAFLNGKFYIGAGRDDEALGSTIIYSVDGVNWEGVTWSSSWDGNTSVFSSMAYGAGTYVASIGNGASIATSTDGMEWTYYYTRDLLPSGRYNTVSYGDERFLVGGHNFNDPQQGIIAKSSNGTNWNEINSTVVDTTTDIISIANNGSRFVAVGNNGKIYRTDTADSVYPTVESISPVDVNLRSVAYGDGIFVAVGYSGKIISSSNGVDWVEEASGTTKNLYDVMYDGNNFIVSGGSGILKRITTPLVSTTQVEDVSSAFATVGGNIISDRGANITEMGIVYAASPAPQIGGEGVVKASFHDAGTGHFTVNLTGLDRTTTYFARAYATNEIGTSYGKDVTFTTLYNTAPVVTDSTKNGIEDTILTFTASDFNEEVYSDIDGDLLDGIKIVTIPDSANGVLKLNNTNIIAGYEISAENLGSITFLPELDFYGNASLEWKASDGIDYSELAATLTITIADMPESSECDITSVAVPSNVSISANTVTASVYNENTSVKVDLEVSPEASWALYIDSECINEIVNKTMNLSVGANTAYIEVTAKDGTKKTYTLTINRVEGDVNLTGLALSNGMLSPTFDSSTTCYTVRVQNSVNSIMVTPTLSDSNASLTVNGKVSTEAVSLEVGENTINIVVTGEDGVSTKIYEITVIREAVLSIKTDTLPTGIIGESYSTTLEAEGGSESYTWQAEVLPNWLSLGTATGGISGTPVDTGSYDIWVTVTDENNNTDTKEFTLTIAQSLSIDLADIMVSQGSLSPSFDKNTVTYQLEGVINIESLEITAELSDASANLTIDGESAQSSTAKTVTLEQGANLIPIVVTSPDGNTQKSYIISVNGTVSDADLYNLTLSTESESWVLIEDGMRTGSTIESDTADYISVGNDTETINISATPSDSKALVLIEGNVSRNSAIDLEIGENDIEVMVVAQDASAKTYKVTVNRASGDVNLSDITLSYGTLSPAFIKATTEYSVDVPYTVESITVSPILSDSDSSVMVNGKTPTQAIGLQVGENTINIEVIGKDGVSTKTYTINVTRKKALTINNKSLPIGIVDGIYNADLTAEGGTEPYTWTVIGLPEELTINEATGEITGVPANEGNYTIEIMVKDEDENISTKTLTLKINLGCGNGAYIVKPNEDSVYTSGYTEDGIPIMTVNEGISGFKYFSVTIEPVTGHSGKEVCVFIHMRNGEQIGINYIKSDLDEINCVGAAFNVKAGDIIKSYIVDDLNNDEDTNPNVL